MIIKKTRRKKRVTVPKETDGYSESSAIRKPVRQSESHAERNPNYESESLNIRNPLLGSES